MVKVKGLPTFDYNTFEPHFLIGTLKNGILSVISLAKSKSHTHVTIYTFAAQLWNIPICV